MKGDVFKTKGSSSKSNQAKTAFLKKLVNQEGDVQKHLIKALQELPNYGGDCHCSLGSFDKWASIHEGNFDEIVKYCLKCGGVVS